jgi:hypothetical protein
MSVSKEVTLRMIDRAIEIGREQGLEEAAKVVDTACHVDESLAKLAQAIRDMKND